MTNKTKPNGKQKSIKTLRKEAKEEYIKVGEVHCPYFNEKIHFTSEGFNHLRYRKGRKERHLSVQEMRYKLLKYAKQVIEKSNTLQEHEKRNLFVEERKHKKRIKNIKKVEFFGFIAIIDNWKVKVIIRQVENHPKHFWSVIPNWQTRKSKERKNNFQNYTGNLSED